MTINIHQSARDLQGIAKSMVANPSVGKRIRHSRAFSPFRRAGQSKGAFASATFGLVQKGVSTAIGLIPVPVVGSLVDKAWGKLNELGRAKHYKQHIDFPVNSADRVKFELKTIGDEVADLDRYRWKISKAVANYNKVASEVMQGIDSAPCDAWVRVWAKYYYLGSRIGKLRDAIDGLQAILLEADIWLDQVEQSYEKPFEQMKAQYEKDVRQLKTMAGAHEACSKHTCMFKMGRWTDKPTVPTSRVANFFVKAAGELSTTFGDDPVGDAVGEIPM